MCERATATVKRAGSDHCRVLNRSALNLNVENYTYDAVVSTFGLKTLRNDELVSFIKEVKRILKPGGAFSILEFSIPQNPVIRFFFRLYVRNYVPFLGWVFLGNPDNYRMLWRYTSKFQSCEQAFNIFKQQGIEVELRSHFLGSATQVVGRTPI
jgi:demethylmenaquinone methyltransferase/2-methoxy-6-polyprenyl-1,4-benzoquinol methylase